MRGKKIAMIIITLALLLGCVVLLRLQRDKPIGPSVSEASRLSGNQFFEIQVEMPAFNSGRSPLEIPGVILGYNRGPRFDQASPGAQVGKIAPNHIELSADDGWDLLIETDREGRFAQGTHVGFPVKLGGRPLRFNCRPADPSRGYLHTTARAGSDELDGSFQLEIAICTNAVSGKTAAWPYKPLKVRGNFAGLKKQGRRMNKVRPMSEYGCKECWSSEASEAWKAVTSIPIQAYLIDESHYIVSIRVCPSCSQHYLQVTSETVDWKEGEDPIYRTIIPIDDAERTEWLGQDPQTSKRRRTR